jgi:hypothetical protein
MFHVLICRTLFSLFELSSYWAALVSVLRSLRRRMFVGLRPTIAFVGNNVLKVGTGGQSIP